MVSQVNSFFGFSESYQDIETTVTEMKSCLELLLVDDFGLSNQTPARTQNCLSMGDAALGGLALAHSRIEYEVPCSSQSLPAVGALWKEMEENRGSNERREEKNEIKCLDPRMDKTLSPEAVEMAVMEGTAQKTNQDCEEKEADGDEETQIDVPDEDVFIRNSGLLSHAYSLNINTFGG